MEAAGTIRIKKMQEAHIDAVTAIEKVCFAIPWTRGDFQREVQENKMAIYYIAEYEEKVVGYAGMWHVINEGHITNVAILPEYRGAGIGAKLLEALLKTAEALEMIGITLEVKISNSTAQKLYTKYGFKPEGFRKRYYQDTGEDAVIMWKYFPIYEKYQESQ